MLDVVLAIDDPLAALGLETGLMETGTATSVTSAEGPQDLERVLADFDEPIVILDAAYRIQDPDIVRRLTASHPGCAVLMFVRHASDECVLRGLLKAGSRARLSTDAIRRLDECCLTALDGDARGCVPSDASPEAVGRAIEAVRDGEIAAAPWITAAVTHQHGDAGIGSAITQRELEVMALVAKGCSNKEIGRRLAIREQTVKNHLGSVMTKMGVSTRLELGIKASRMSLCLRDDEDGSKS